VAVADALGMGLGPEDCALHMMRTTGSVPATVIADTDDGYVFCVPADLADEAAKDRFAEIARAPVVIGDIRVKYANAAGELDTNIPPSPRLALRIHLLRPAGGDPDHDDPLPDVRPPGL
jgi:hypothetical protein